VALGFENIHIDLMYGLPGQDLGSWEETLKTVTKLPAQHASAYKLYIYKHGQLHREAIARRPEYELDPYNKQCSEMSNLATSIFEDAGLYQYSLTEFAKEGMECRYVTACFDGSDVLPIGPSAFGRCGREVWDNSPYAHLFENDDFGREHDRAIVLSPNEVFKRDVLLGLWLLRVDLNALSNEHNVIPSKRLLKLLQEMAESGWIEFDGTIVRLLKSQRFLVGFPMEHLTKLQASEWCEKGDTDTTLEAVEPTKLMQRRQELNFVVRMARRDPKFFFAVNNEPFEALERAGFKGELAEVEMLIRSISEVSLQELTEEEVQLRALWKLVEKEHLRGLKSRQIAGLT
jgi:oxygen-independent coproporphyrinogen-3 oxidase